jgi:uncharacterized linocin/CFP29 family protein
MPFKDNVKKLAYGRKYQAEGREKLKEQRELEDFEKQAVATFRHHCVGRQLFCLRPFPDDHIEKHYADTLIHKVLKFPVISIHISSSITSSKIDDATLKIVEEEDRLLLVGEHKGWSAFGIEGLATAKGRNIIKSCGNFWKDLAKATKQLKQCGHLPPYSVISKYGISILGWPMGSDFWASPILCSQEGKQDNMLVVKPNVDNFAVLMGQDLTLCRQENRAYMLWETLIPAIYQPKAICEIQRIPMNCSPQKY